MVFSHNDSQENNFLVSTETDEIKLIDFEYSCPNYRGFDVGNYLAEAGITYMTDKACGFELDEQNEPTDE